MIVTFEEIEEFLKENYAPCKSWHTLNSQLRWFTHFNCIEVIKTDEIKAVAMARLVKNAEDGKEHYNMDPMGDTLFVDLVVCKDESYKPHLLSAIQLKMGQPEFIAFKRFKKKNGKIYKYHFTKLMQRFIDMKGK